jgi:hypothetical protein
MTEGRARQDYSQPCGAARRLALRQPNAGRSFRSRRWARCLVAAALVLFTVGCWAGGDPTGGFPRIFGMNIGGPIFYADPVKQKALSRHAVVILGFYDGWEADQKRKHRMAEVVKAIKKHNPRILVGQYSILPESQDQNFRAARARALKIDRENWWLRDARGKRQQWTSQYGAWDVNISKWAIADENGQRYPEWLANYLYETFFRDTPEFDIWYFDNALSRPATKSADWNRDGVDEARDAAHVAQAYREAQTAHWAEAKRLAPRLLQMVNSDDLSSEEYRGKAGGVFLEAMIGEWWSSEARKGWQGMMQRYHEAMRDTKTPHMVVFNVHGKVDDYQRLRYGLASSLMDNGMFSYSDETANYRAVPWFDEFDVDLGMPTEPPQTSAGQDGIYRRAFERGLVLVNPSPHNVIVSLGGRYRRLHGNQDPGVNSGEVADSIVLKSKDGILLERFDSP